ncbi:hypothetical protein Aspvir_003775 [Aspergillus viridinutans]|uniref:DUF614 domain protein n=1 Tax=Aspergillus viridinutans TaxID=75553 RepID=A0A9P3F376_ASPVI|nr:uncharacterized protein Aspvir_003775 [Aspergillus viridinutans]GIJ99772.1 hypothetical protein Aspvir_003775 [Aspergillus viridinutans]
MDPQLRLDTSFGAGTQRYSFIETPLELNPSRQRIERQVPLSGSETKANACPVQQQVTATEDIQPTFNEKAQLQHESAASVYPGGPPIEQHPAHYAPYAEDAPQQAQFDTFAPAYSYSAGHDPLPVKADPEASDKVAESRKISVAPDENPLHSPRLPRFPPPIMTSAPHPTTPMSYHQPGQIAHPNQVVKGGTWSHGLCECSSIGTCCLGLLCPCILYGRTQYRLSMKAKKENPTNMLGHETCNGSCTAMALLCGCQWLLATVQHTRTRKAYGISGNVGSDCVRATCCTCCTLIQDEKEFKTREEERERAAWATGQALLSPYAAPLQMSYGQPPR